MSTGTKYTPEQLGLMANIVLDEEEAGSPRPLHLYITIAAMTGLPALDVRDRIRAFAGRPNAEA